MQFGQFNGFDQLFSGDDTNQEQSIEPSFLGGTLDPHLLDSRPQDQSVDPSNLMNQIATTQAHPPIPPHLLQPTMSHQNSSPRASPSLNQGAFPTPGHSRHVSLDPSAAYTQGQGVDWGGMSFHNHRRAPTDTYSDVSPYLWNNDSFDYNGNPSPLLSAQQDPNQSHAGPSRGSYTSPRLISQQQPFGAVDVQTGPADTMPPPGINIDFAPPSRPVSSRPVSYPADVDALTPPDRFRGKPEDLNLPCQPTLQ